MSALAPPYPYVGERPWAAALQAYIDAQTASSASEGRAAVKTFNVMDYGAKGDGVTVDGPFIQAAIDAAATAGGGNIIVPNFGNAYVIAGGGSTCLRLKSNTHLIGIGNPTLLMQPSTTPVLPLMIAKSTAAVSNISVQGFILDGNLANMTGGFTGFDYLISFSAGGRNITVADNEFKNALQGAIYVSNAVAGGTGTDDLFILRNYCHDFNTIQGSGMIFLGSVHNFHVHGNRCSACWDDVFALMSAGGLYQSTPGAWTYNGEISGNIFTNSSNANTVRLDGHDIKFHHNICVNEGQGWSNCWLGPTDTTRSACPYDVEISDNILLCRQTSGDGGSGIKISAGAGLRIRNNHILACPASVTPGTGQHGIRLGATTGEHLNVTLFPQVRGPVEIEGNVIHGGWAGIWVSPSAAAGGITNGDSFTDVRIRRNSIFDSYEDGIFGFTQTQQQILHCDQNVIEGCGRHGVNLESGSHWNLATLLDNRASNNGGYGVRIGSNIGHSAPPLTRVKLAADGGNVLGEFSCDSTQPQIGLYFQELGLLKRATFATPGPGSGVFGPTTIKAELELQGAGGAGGGVTGAGANRAGGPGAAGAWTRRIFGVTPGAAYTYAVGNAGLGAANAAGGDGGDTSFTSGTVRVDAGGGKGGALGNAATAVNLPAAGGIPRGGELMVVGGTSDIWDMTAAFSRKGADTRFGSGGPPRMTSGDGLAALPDQTQIGSYLGQVGQYNVNSSVTSFTIPITKTTDQESSLFLRISFSGAAGGDPVEVIDTKGNQWSFYVGAAGGGAIGGQKIIIATCAQDVAPLVAGTDSITVDVTTAACMAVVDEFSGASVISGVFGASASVVNGNVRDVGPLVVSHAGTLLIVTYFVQGNDTVLTAGAGFSLPATPVISQGVGPARSLMSQYQFLPNAGTFPTQATANGSPATGIGCAYTYNLYGLPQSYGAGGSGGLDLGTSTNRAGGNGGGGLITLREYGYGDVTP